MAVKRFYGNLTLDFPKMILANTKVFGLPFFKKVTAYFSQKEK